MKNPFASTRRHPGADLVDRSAPREKEIDDRPDDWHAVAYPLLSPQEGRTELEKMVEREVARLMGTGSLDEAHGGVLDHLIEDFRRQMEEHITRHHRTRIATQAGLTKRARVNHERACVELRDLRPEHAEALESRRHHRDLLLGRAPDGDLRLASAGGDAVLRSRPIVMPDPEVDTSGLHGPVQVPGARAGGDA